MLGHECDPKHECAIIHSPHVANIQYTLVFIGISHKPTMCGIMRNSLPCDYFELHCLLLIYIQSCCIIRVVGIMYV